MCCNQMRQINDYVNCYSTFSFYFVYMIPSVDFEIIKVNYFVYQ